MPWTAESMRAKGAKRPGVAAKVANDYLRMCLDSGRPAKQCEASAIRIGLFASNRGKENKP